MQRACGKVSFSAERDAHVPPGAGSGDAHRVGVVVTGNHPNATVLSGYVVRLVLPLHSFWDQKSKKFLKLPQLDPMFCSYRYLWSL